ncbi:MAG: carboxypeptidase regulatory-like protein [Bacteroidetes bacterium]|nr:carboxypeptidase regulatory-like protein [Bacteroidota bacterium]
MLGAQEKVSLSGTVTDFDGNPIDSVSVRLKNKKFENVYETLTDINGRFSLQVEKGNYYCLYAIKLSDYRKTKLEYWTWNVPIFEDIEINPQYNNMEIYGINVFEPQVGPYETYMIYFRPMSLKKSNEIVENQKIDKTAYEKVAKVEKLLTPLEDNIFDIAPNNITSDELSVKINGIESKILNIQKVKDYSRGINMYGYFIQVLKPEEIKTMDVVYDKITIVLNSLESNEIGMGEAFFKRIN